MAKKDNPPPPPEPKPRGNPLLECPNFSTCGTNVRASARGNPHRYGVLEDGEIVYKDCNGG